MNFGVRDLIKWGIPGWLFITVLLSYFLMDDRKSFIRYIHGYDISFGGFITVLLGFGIILGYAIYQMSVLFGFVIWNKWENYFRHEFRMDQIIINAPNGEKTLRIYSSRLALVESLRALNASCILSCISLILLFYSHSWTTGTILLFLINALLLLISFANQRYHRKNLDYFITRILVESNRL
ncbi:hypothetical protein [Peribacillus deserti]|nr:hypothetical protein [Peribacillus deserti]